MGIDKSLYKSIFFLAAVIYSLTAFNSKGYYHADEHYQIIEFAGLKLGTHTLGDLAIKFNGEYIRSAAMPTLCYLLFASLHFFQIDDPYTQTAILRILTGLIGLGAIHYFMRATIYQVKEENKIWYIILSLFLWFLPVLNVRFSSETLSGIAFLFAAAVSSQKNTNKNGMYVIGGLLGLSFLFRFQSAILAISLLLWLIFIRKISRKNVYEICISFFLILTLGIIVDTWYYQEFTLSFINYFNQFINADESPYTFGTSPWYQYLLYILKYSFYPIGILIIISLIIVLIKKPMYQIVWCMFPFLIIHSIILHKEERFLFPVINFIPLFLILAYQEVFQIVNYKYIKIFKNVILLCCLLLNMLGLIIMASKSAGVGRMAVAYFIHENYPDKPLNLIRSIWCSPYTPWESTPSKYYQEKNITEQQLHSLCDLNDSIIDPNKVNLLIIEKSELTNSDCNKILTEMGFVSRTQSIPLWIDMLNNTYPLIEQTTILYELPPKSR